MAKEDCYGGRALVKMTVSGLTGRDLWASKEAQDDDMKDSGVTLPDEEEEINEEVV